MTELVRYEAARRALAEAVAVDEVVDIRSKAEAMRVYARQASDKGLEIQAAQIRFRAERRLGEMIVAQKETVGLNAGSRGQLQGKGDSGGAVVEQPEDERPRLADIGVDRKLSSKAQKLAAMDVAEFERALARHKEEMESGAGRVAMDLLKIDAEEKGRVHRRDLSSALASASALTPSGKKYPASYSDPPWVRKAGIGNRAYENHYATMPWPEILKYLERVGEAMQPDAWHWMWIPRAHLLAKVPYKIEVMLADGEVVMATADLPLAYACQLALGMDSYSTCYVWTKTDEEHPDESGTGLLVWDQDELLLQFKRGRGLPKPASDEKFGSNHRERKREHSRKPDHYRHMIATMVGKDSDGAPLPVLELFARVDAEHPLPENWDAWGNQAGVALTSAVEIPTVAAPSPSSAGATETIILSGYGVDRLKQREWAGDVGAVDDDGEPPAQSDDIRGLWMHPAVQGRHVVSNTRDGKFSVATCQCGWGFRAKTAPVGWQLRDDAVDAHWRDVIAEHDLPEPSGETEAAAAEATSEGASAAAAVADGAPYDAGDVITIDQLAGSEWLAPTETPEFDPASIGERDALKILSDFCHPRRDVASVLGAFYQARGYTRQQGEQWALRGAGWDRLRELEAVELPPAPKADLTEPYRAPQMSLFDASRQLDDAPPADVVDGALQTRLPVDADELAEQLALLEISAGRWDAVEPDMIRHLVGARGFAHCTTERVLVTDEGAAFLAQLVAPAASVQQQGEMHG
ncbi:methyltransferase-A70 family protein [Bradyrhizobium diazoefficiens]|uniref:Uncharacterized protein n=1 Tax=Bradyrhizobium diazoefficiens TaxID=1355477 RepID=A0A809YMR7_9BRAD|nr:hypothetical protein [Bradyrhizobium diazoefficiens]BCA04174.1 hypothetical protein H12S4_50780 [Bradyrhizobium diazoefficiens]BCE39700.1 hypothetical protein XF3B_47310 [Bradyrhizobium diazoefficiens]BCF53096.1 hypothetical protein XF17B_47340 [Bradyrhizobium diazoefficiens]